MKTTPEQRTPRIKLQTHGVKLVKDAAGEIVEVERFAYDKHFHSITAMRQAFEDIPLAGCDMAARTTKRIVRGLRGFAGKRRMAGWWIYRNQRRTA